MNIRTDFAEFKTIKIKYAYTTFIEPSRKTKKSMRLRERFKTGTTARRRTSVGRFVQSTIFLKDPNFTFYLRAQNSKRI